MNFDLYQLVKKKKKAEKNKLAQIAKSIGTKSDNVVLVNAFEQELKALGVSDNELKELND